MKLETKKNLAARTFGIGKNRIIFNSQRLSELKEAITKQDMRDLKQTGVIMIKPKKGRRTSVKRKTRRREGSIKGKTKMKKQIYVKLTRKLRLHLKKLKEKNKIPRKKYFELRKEIRNKAFRSLAHMKKLMREEKIK